MHAIGSGREENGCMGRKAKINFSIHIPLFQKRLHGDAAQQIIINQLGESAFTHKMMAIV